MKRKIIGNTVGMGLPKPNLMQTDPSKGDYVKGKTEFIKQVNGGATDEQIAAAVDKYLTENPPSGGVNFETDTSLTLEDGVLSVKTANAATKDDARPITSGAVYEEFSKAVALLKTI